MGAKGGGQVDKWKVRQHARSERADQSLGFSVGDLWFRGVRCGHGFEGTTLVSESGIIIIITIIVVVVFGVSAVLRFQL